MSSDSSVPYGYKAKAVAFWRGLKEKQVDEINAGEEGGEGLGAEPEEITERQARNRKKSKRKPKRRKKQNRKFEQVQNKFKKVKSLYQLYRSVTHFCFSVLFHYRLTNKIHMGDPETYDQNDI